MGHAPIQGSGKTRGRQRCRRGRRAAAFSLLEMLISVTILALLASLVVTSGNPDRTRLRAAARMLIADLEYAQLESMAHDDDPLVVVFDTTQDLYSIATESDPATPIDAPQDGQPFVVEYGRDRAADLTGISISGYALDGDDQLGFGRHGELDQLAPAAITLESTAGESITITIDPSTGEASVGPIVE